MAGLQDSRRAVCASACNSSNALSKPPRACLAKHHIAFSQPGLPQDEDGDEAHEFLIEDEDRGWGRRPTASVRRLRGSPTMSESVPGDRRAEVTRNLQSEAGPE